MNDEKERLDASGRNHGSHQAGSSPFFTTTRPSHFLELKTGLPAGWTAAETPRERVNARELTARGMILLLRGKETS